MSMCMRVSWAWLGFAWLGQARLGQARLGLWEERGDGSSWWASWYTFANMVLSTVEKGARSRDATIRATWFTTPLDITKTQCNSSTSHWPKKFVIFNS